MLSIYQYICSFRKTSHVFFTYEIQSRKSIYMLHIMDDILVNIKNMCSLILHLNIISNYIDKLYFMLDNSINF